MIAVELFSAQKHYDQVCSWWTAQKWPVVPLSHLPKTGIVVTSDGAPAAAAWLYKTDSAFCLLEWIVANPEVRHELRSNVLSVLISSLKLMARMMGFESIFMTIKHQSLAKRVEAHGFMASEQGVTNYVCDLARG